MSAAAVVKPNKTVAVVLLNLGGPDGPDAVEPFLRNLFSDPAIIRAPAPIRWFVARLISRTRAASARANYAKMGGGSPLLPETEKQARALEAELSARGLDARCVIAMRYWKPFTADAADAVRAMAPDEVVLLPLYPQYSTTTTASSLLAWTKGGGPAARTVCCYPAEKKFIAAHARKLVETWRAAGSPPNLRCLLSAHGLPKTVVAGGDPYQAQVEMTAAALRPHLPAEWKVDVCYQSRVGPLEWIGPSTDGEIRKAAAAGEAILLAPVAFVSEHIETLVELDEEYRHLAEAGGCKTYLRAPALGTDADFISCLADQVEGALSDDQLLRSACGGRICPANWSGCPNMRPQAAAG